MDALLLESKRAGEMEVEGGCEQQERVLNSHLSRAARRVADDVFPESSECTLSDFLILSGWKALFNGELLAGLTTTWRGSETTAEGWNADKGARKCAPG